MDAIPAFTPTLDAFVLLNWGMTIASAGWFVFTFRRSRFLFTKPSILVLLWSHLFFQWPATIYAAYYEKVLPDPYAIALLVHGFVLAGLLVSTRTFHESSKEIFYRLTIPPPANILLSTAILASYCVAVTIIYLSFVPLTSTGLYAILMHPALAALAREDSLKLITNTPLRYAYQIMASAAAPLLAVNLALLMSRAARAGRFVIGLFLASIFVLLLFVASLPGNRGTAAKLLLVVATAWFLIRGLPFRPLYFFAVLTAILAPVALITLLREGKDFSGALFVTYLTESILNRVFVVPINVGAFYVHYAQTHGPIGIAGVTRIASILGINPVPAANIIGNLYSYSGLESVTANAGFLFTYYGYFGMLSLPLSLVGVWLLDLAVPIYRRVEPGLFLPTVAATSVASLAFISSEYTTVLVTHGFAVVLLLGVLISRWHRRGHGRSLAPLHSNQMARIVGP